MECSCRKAGRGTPLENGRPLQVLAFHASGRPGLGNRESIHALTLAQVDAPGSQEHAPVVRRVDRQTERLGACPSNRL